MYIMHSFLLTVEARHFFANIRLCVFTGDQSPGVGAQCPGGRTELRVQV